MKVLVVCSKNSGQIAPFILEQVDALNKAGIITDFFTVEQKGLMGYFRSRKLLLQKIKSFQPDLIHAHYGLSGLLANLQRKVAVVTTYHGSDINDSKVFMFSFLSILLSKFNIFVSQSNIDKSRVKNNYALIPCGVDIEVFKPMDKMTARKILNLDFDKNYILFSGGFNNIVKNPELAIAASKEIDNTELLELKGYNREEVMCLMNADDVCIMTSFSEGSPQFIKEAMACNCPIVSVDVGDVKEVIGDTEGCYVSSYDVNKLTANLRHVLQNNQRTEGRKRIIELGLDSETIAKKIVEIYRKV
jgi:glycosyltransferase involved in cell wall biosynthesis